MEHDVIRKYGDERIRISGWAEQAQQHPKDCPERTVGRAAYRTFGHTTDHLIPPTTYQALCGQASSAKEQQQQQQQTGRKCRRLVKFCPYITTYQRDYVNHFPALLAMMKMDEKRKEARKAAKFSNAPPPMPATTV